MHFSFSSVYMAIITSNLVLVLLVICFRSRKIMASAGYRLLLLFMGCTIFRFLFPIELTFSRNILLPKALSFAITWVRHPLFEISHYKFRLWPFLHLIWLVGFIIQLSRYIRRCKETHYKILACSLDVTNQEPYQSVVDALCKMKKKENCFRVYEVTGIQIPMLYGISSPVILVPENWDIPQQSLFLALSHEIAHHYNHDILIKHLVNILAAIYWWNPFCRTLIYQTSLILEMRVDHAIVGNSKQTIITYMNSLLTIMERIDETVPCPIPDALTISFSRMNQSELKHRFHMMTTDIGWKKYLIKIAMVILIFGIFIFSYMYTFEAHYISPSEEEYTIEPSSADIYAIQNEDGSYDIFFGSLLIDHVESLEYYSEDIPIYTNEKEK